MTDMLLDSVSLYTVSEANTITMLITQREKFEDVGKTPERVGRKYKSKMMAKTLTAQRVGLEKNDEMKSPMARSAQAQRKKARVEVKADKNETSP
jgi:hypothetical protein